MCVLGGFLRSCDFRLKGVHVNVSSLDCAPKLWVSGGGEGRFSPWSPTPNPFLCHWMV